MNSLPSQECSSLCSQLGYTYSSQRKTSTPFSSLVFSSLGGQIKTHLETVGQGSYERWKHVEWWEEGYDSLWNSVSASVSDESHIKSRIIYLTADSDSEISELEPGFTYIIGGIVDHNRYKNLCLRKAVKQGIRTAKLPIGKYLAGTCLAALMYRLLNRPRWINLEMKTRKVWMIASIIGTLATIIFRF